MASMETKTAWDMICALYWEEFSIPPRIIDLVAVKPILMKCVSGYGNKRIALSTDDDTQYIANTLEEFLGFGGWSKDLDFNPLALYNRAEKNFDGYANEVRMVSTVTDDEVLELSFELCRRYYGIDKEIRKFYDD